MQLLPPRSLHKHNAQRGGYWLYPLYLHICFIYWGLSLNIPRALQALAPPRYPYLVLAAASLHLASVKDKQHTKGEQESHPLVGAPATQELGLGRKGHWVPHLEHPRETQVRASLWASSLESGITSLRCRQMKSILHSRSNGLSQVFPAFQLSHSLFVKVTFSISPMYPPSRKAFFYSVTFI